MSDNELHGVADDQPFELRLAQTIAWCSPRARLDDPATSLRSDRLQPSAFETERATSVSLVLESRASIDRDVGTASPVNTANDLGGGRLLLYFPDANLADGAAEVETRGFLDIENMPPWDTWV